MMFFYNDNWREVIVKHRKRINKRKVLFVFIICVLMIYSVIFVCQKVNGLLKGEIEYYSIVKKDINREYLGSGITRLFKQLIKRFIKNINRIFFLGKIILIGKERWKIMVVELLRWPFY